MTLTELAQAMETKLDALTGFAPSSFVFSPEYVPDQIQHRAFLIAPGDFTPAVSSGAVEWEVDLEVRVAYLVPQFTGEKGLLHSQIFSDLEAMVLALVAIDEIGSNRPWSTRIESAEGGQSMVLTLRVPASLCQPRTP